MCRVKGNSQQTPRVRGITNIATCTITGSDEVNPESGRGSTSRNWLPLLVDNGVSSVLTNTDSISWSRNHRCHILPGHVPHPLHRTRMDTAWTQHVVLGQPWGPKLRNLPPGPSGPREPIPSGSDNSGRVLGDTALRQPLRRGWGSGSICLVASW